MSDRALVDLSGRVVLVTGASRGIGARVAVAAARAGAAVAVGYRSFEAGADQVAAEIRAADGTAESFACDVSVAREVEALVAAVEARFGRVDGLVNAAAVMMVGGFLETTDAHWEEILRTDLHSVVFMCRTVMPGMLAQGHGSIVNIVSRLADVGASDAAPYAVAKAGVVALTKSLALAYGEAGVRVNCVSPGTTDTDMGRAVTASPAGRERRLRIPIRRFVEPVEVANAAVFLLSDAAGALTGQTLHANGGEYMP